MAQDSALALLETINEILDFSKMQNGSLSFEEAPFDLIEVVRLTVEHLIPRFEEKPGLALCWDIAPDVPNVVIGDAARIRNVLINLLGNAFKFADHGHITLRVSSYQCSDLKKHGFRFSVTDTGIGISSNKLNTIFDPFTTADEKTARLYAGAGLGLAIVKQITEKLGGSISVESEPDQGSTFSVDLPLAVASEATDTDVTTTKTYKVAVLATPDIRQTTVAHGLSAFGCTVSLFSLDNPEQLEILQANCSHFDIIHVIKAKDILMDELNPLIHAAAKNNVRIVFSVTSAEISSSDLLARSDKCFVTLQPTSALDILLICEGKLTPKSSLRETDEPAEKADQKLNILIADDTKTNRIILKNLLEDAGHNVEVVENGKQLLERIAFKPEHFDRQQLPFDLVLTDIQMPVMDGITATQNFRELERQSNASKKLPIVAVTSYAFPEECSKMLASGIDHILTKPINPKRLSRLISQITSQSEQLSQSQEEEQTDPQIIEQLCQLTETVVQRIGELNSAIVSHPNEPSTTVLDLQGVYERSGNSIRRTGLILTSFLESYQEQLLILEATKLKDEDPAKLRRLVHALKGLLLDAGAQTAANLAVALEDKMVREPQAVTMQEILKFVNSVHEAARVIKEIANALPSFEIYSALPSIGHELMVH
jgi:CheY-like chemotaxis protein/HPt (histidine-containing phosphotransfer) domain-containing protein